MEGAPWAKKIYDEAGLTVWQAPISEDAKVLSTCFELLSASERARFERYGHRWKAITFALGRGTLRRILGAELGEEPRSLQIETDENGKPFLVGRAVEFSVSASRDLALIALSTCGAVGVDIEWIDPSPGSLAAILRHCNSKERQYLEGSSLAEAFQAWTLKEACAKALGMGMKMPLSSLEVLFSDRVEAARHDPLSTTRLAVPEGYCGAVATFPQEL
ncbi:MAG: 4'-phosphopantetheinyl transferase superfamily protein [Armatimonadetes bacterium]|nr:4'-phosphopantetheinyl transferase superfamily protein [Armatimonadota bacterium]